jgi:tetratricopeptide (TPR) repeat protein
MRPIWTLFVLGVALAQAGPYYERCFRLYQEGALEAAQATCELALVAEPEHGPSRLLLTRIYLDTGQRDKAEGLLQTLPQTPEALRLKARLLLLKGAPAEALALLRGDETPEARLVRAQALFRLGRLEEAEKEALLGLSSPEGRLLLAKIRRELMRPTEALAALGNTPEEEVERARLLLYLGRPQEAVRLLEALAPRLEGRLYREALGLLALSYYAAGDLTRGGAALAQLAQVESLPSLFLRVAWPWLLLFLVFLGLVLYAESRIEPTRTVEMVEDPLPGPGRLYLALLVFLLLAGGLSAWIGHFTHGTYLALFLPYQREAILPLFYLFYGLFSALYVAVRFRKHLPQVLGDPGAWVEAFWVGPVLVLLLFLYGALRGPLGLSGLMPNLVVFLGLALLEPFFRGLAPLVLKERYKDLAPHLSVLLYALAVPGPTLFFLLAGALLTWVHQRTQGVLAGGLGLVVAGVGVALLPRPLVRTRL